MSLCQEWSVGNVLPNPLLDIVFGSLARETGLAMNRNCDKREKVQKEEKEEKR